jgi:putative methionine-R-sulfoxide reductase with GAF domain
LDLDSTELNSFDEIDKINLERICKLLVKTIF